MNCRAEEEGAVDHWSSRSGGNPWRRVARHESHPGGQIQCAHLERLRIEDHRRVLPGVTERATGELALEVLLVLQQCEWT